MEENKFWKNYKLYLRNLGGDLDNLFAPVDQKLPLDEYIRTAYNMVREITFCHDPNPSIQYVMKLTFCLFYESVLSQHHAVEKVEVYGKSVKLMYTLHICYMKHLDELRRKEILDQYIKDVQKIQKAEDLKTLEQERKIVDLGSLFNNNIITIKNEIKKEESEGEIEEEEETNNLSCLKSPLLMSPGMTQISPTVFEKRKELKKVIVNERLINEFLVAAQPHIEKKIEFCGMLVGKVVSIMNSKDWCFQITLCLIPDQAGDTGYVMCYNEEEIYQFQYDNGLIFLGWIHTHPTQSAYLSSRDIYTQYGFQLMLKESIAIVCSPRKRRNYGVFRIKSSKMETVRSITSSKSIGFFGKKLLGFKLSGKMYEDCKHCIVKTDHNSSKSIVVDLRKNKEVSVLN